MSRGLRQNLPYLNGVYLGVGAVSDLRLVVDGPYCVVQKAELHMAHDPRSDLVSASGVGRIGHTDLRFNQNVVYRMSIDRGQDIVKVLSEVSRLPDTGLVLLTSMDFHQVIAAPLERYRRQARSDDGAPIALLESRSLVGDWLEGYAAVLERVAALTPLPDPDPEPGSVAVVGHLFDRRAGDVAGNMGEIKRLLDGLGLSTVLVWPDGREATGLGAVARAETLVSLPYGREAARRLAERLGIHLVEAPLPLGLERTRAFLEAVAGATGRQAGLDGFWDREMTSMVPGVRDLSFRYLVGRKAWLQADPHVAVGLSGLLRDLGIETTDLSVMGRADGLDDDTRERLAAMGAVFEPLLVDRGADGMVVDADRDLDVVVAGTLFPHRPRRATWIPFGYPNYLVHPVRPAPYLGLEGVNWWVERLTEAAQMTETHSSGTPLGGEVEVMGDGR